MSGQSRASSIAAVVVALLLVWLAAPRLIEWADDPQNVVLTTWRRVSGTEPPAGRWRVVRNRAQQQLAEAQALEAIGYVSGSEAAHADVGVVVHRQGEAFPGYNLVVSGDAAAALLLDMDGREVHRWAHAWQDAFPDERPDVLTPEEDRVREGRQAWRRALLLPDGSLVGIHEGFGIVRVDRDSRLLWAKRNGAHHDLTLDEDGRIWTLTRAAKMRRERAEGPILEDFVTVLGQDGEEVERFSVMDALARSHVSGLLAHAPRDHGDWLHTNTIELLDGTHAALGPAFGRGNVIVSWPYLDTVAVLDVPQRKVVWAMTGWWKFQHEPQLTPEGRMIVLDNRRGEPFSRVLELDPTTQQVTRVYQGNATNGFSTETCGGLQRLPNGNTLVVESDSGRAFELAPDFRTTVWAYHSPARAGTEGELVATLFDVVRIAPEDLPEGLVATP